MTTQIRSELQQIENQILYADGPSFPKKRSRYCFGKQLKINDEDWWIPHGKAQTEDSRCDFCISRGIVDKNSCYGPIKINTYENNLIHTTCCDSPNDPKLYRLDYNGYEISMVNEEDIPYYLVPDKRYKTAEGVGYYWVPTYCNAMIKVYNETVDHFTVECSVDGVLPDAIKYMDELIVGHIIVYGFGFYYRSKYEDNYSGEDPDRVILTCNSFDGNSNLVSTTVINIFVNTFQTHEERLNDNFMQNHKELTYSNQTILEQTGALYNLCDTIDIKKASLQQLLDQNNEELEKVKAEWITMQDKVKNIQQVDHDNHDSDEDSIFITI